VGKKWRADVTCDHPIVRSRNILYLICRFTAQSVGISKHFSWPNTSSIRTGGAAMIAIRRSL
jgi:hypothetical protein